MIPGAQRKGENSMTEQAFDEEKLNGEIRKFLKKVA